MSLVSPTVEIRLDGVWTNITSYVRAADGIQIRRGQRDEQPTFEASICTLTLNNADGRFSPRNPTGAYYGTIGRNTPIRVKVGSDNRFYGEVSAWPTTWDESGRVAWTTVQAAGIVRRLAQGYPPLQGPIKRYIQADSSPTPVAYWPMDDPQGSTSLASGLSGYPAMTLEGTSLPQPGTYSEFPTTDPIVVLNNGATRGVVPLYSGTSVWSAFLLAVPQIDTNDATLLRFLATGTAYRWELRYFTASSGHLILRCFDNNGVSILTSGTIAAGLDGSPSTVEIEFVQNGADIGWYVTVTNFETGVASFLGGTLAGRTVGIIDQIQFNADRALATAAVGQFVLYATDPGTLYNEYSGFVGETAGRRVERLCGEEGITFSSSGDLDQTEAMGSQIAGTFLDVLQQCSNLDMGYLYEPRSALGIEYRTRESLYDQAATTTLAYTNLDGIEPVEDDQATRNDVTVTRSGGSSARYELTTGALSVNTPPDGVGRYREEVPPLIIETDARLEHHAAWRVAVGTVDEPRYPTITADINLLSGATRTAAIALGIGDRLTVTGMPKWVPPNSIDVHVVGYTETIYPHGWSLELNCVPASPYLEAFVLNDTVNGRLDAAASTLNEDLTTTETDVTYANGPWVNNTTPSEFPFDIEIGGEVMTVTTATATTFTVTRSVNGVVKTHSTGAPIHLAQPNRIVL